MSAVPEPSGGWRIVAIHQPNFLPWLGYFDKLARCDVFVLLDSVQFPKKSGTWMNRVKLLVVAASRRGSPCRSCAPTTACAASTRWRSTTRGRGGASCSRRSSRTIGARRTSTETMPLVTDSRHAREPAARRLQRGRRAPTRGRARARRRASSSASSTSGRHRRGDRPADRDHAQARRRLLPRRRGREAAIRRTRSSPRPVVRLRYQAFEHPTYPQPDGQPAAGLSIVDALMHCGADGARLLAGWTARPGR